MLKKCFFARCSEKVTTSCSCKGNPIYICNAHLANHCSTSGSHVIVSHNLKFLTKAQETLQQLQKTKKEIINQTEKLLEYVVEASKKTLANIKKTEKIVENFIINTLTGNKISNREYEKFAKVSTQKKEPCFTDNSKIIQELSKFYQINSLEAKVFEDFECDEIIFSKKAFCRGLWSIDLKTFISRELDYVNIGLGGGGACAITKGVYFFYGGDKRACRGEVNIVNIVKKTVKTFERSTRRCCFACVFKNEKIYVFGGIISLGIFSNEITESSKTFDITLGKWGDIHNLPSKCYETTASVMNNEIIIAGYNFDKVYAYNDICYSPILDVKRGECKVVCDGWIVTSSNLFENKKSKNSKWKAYAISSKVLSLCMYTTFKRGRYIYFTYDNDELWRVNTETKTVEMTKYIS